MSIFHYDNFLLYNDNILYSLVFISAHVVMLIIAAIHEVGIKLVFKSFYRNDKNLSIAINLLLMVIYLLINFVLKPFSLLLRIVLNIFISNIFHDILDGMMYGVVILELLTVLKAALYLIQVYIVILLSNKIYYHMIGESKREISN
jgi:F0F1-type ATP synthase membrane subunit a